MPLALALKKAVVSPRSRRGSRASSDDVGPDSLGRTLPLRQPAASQTDKTITPASGNDFSQLHFTKELRETDSVRAGHTVPLDVSTEGDSYLPNITPRT